MPEVKMQHHNGGSKCCCRSCCCCKKCCCECKSNQPTIVIANPPCPQISYDCPPEMCGNGYASQCPWYNGY
ncbi:hypothetical protein TcWFU_001923 [Taenia crassiceps]|uniref:Uncharacterized protein n=1 Tax=Taenia crassiceps TaxID=6207 RepID=A0ABR4QJ75_9CEST